MKRRMLVLLVTPWLVNAGCGDDGAQETPPPDPVEEFVGMQVALLMTTNTISPLQCIGKPPTDCCRFKVKAPARRGWCDVDAELRCKTANSVRFTMQRFQHALDAEGPYRLSGDLTLQTTTAFVAGKVTGKAAISGTLLVHRGDRLERSGLYDVTSTYTSLSLTEFSTCARGVAFGAKVNRCFSVGMTLP